MTIFHELPTLTTVFDANPICTATETVLRKNLTQAICDLHSARSSIIKLEERSRAAALELATFLKNA